MTPYLRSLVIGIVLLLMQPDAPAWAQWSEDAQKCAEAADPELALAPCTRALQSNQLSEASLVVTFINRGNAYQNKSDYDKAIQDYDQAIRLDSGSALAFNNRGSAYLHKGVYDRAIQDYDEAIRLDGTSAPAFNNRGRANHFKEKYSEAITDYDQAIELDPDYPLAFYNRALARFDQGFYIASVPDFVRALQLDPSNPYRVIGLYLAKARAGDIDRESLASNAAKLNLARWPGPVVALYLGQVTPQAMVQATQDQDPGMQRERQCEAYFYLGEQLLIQGQRGEAARLFQATVATGVTSLFEYASAKAELKRLGP